MPETSTPTLTPDGTTKVPAFQNNNPGNVELGALKSFILNQAGLANGLATLDENGKLDSSQIPASLDDVLVYGSYALLPAVGESGKLYITTDVNGSYYWNGTSYQMLNNSFVRYRETVSSLPSNPQTGDWFIAASTFTEGGVTYTSGAIYLYNGSSWDDATAVFGQFVRKSDISQTLGQQIDKVPSNKCVNDAINAIMYPTPLNPHQFTYEEGVTTGGGGTSCKIGNIVFLNFDVKTTSGKTGEFVVCQLPFNVGTGAVPFSVINWSNNTFCNGFIYRDQLRINGNGGTWYYLSTSFIIPAQ